MNVIPAKLGDCMQPNLKYPSTIHPKRMAFERDFQKYGFEYIMRHYGNVGWHYQLRILPRKIKNKFKQIIKKLIGKK